MCSATPAPTSALDRSAADARPGRSSFATGLSFYRTSSRAEAYAIVNHRGLHRRCGASAGWAPSAGRPAPRARSPRSCGGDAPVAVRAGAERVGHRLRARLRDTTRQVFRERAVERRRPAPRRGGGRARRDHRLRELWGGGRWVDIKARGTRHRDPRAPARRRATIATGATGAGIRGPGCPRWAAPRRRVRERLRGLPRAATHLGRRGSFVPLQRRRPGLVPGGVGANRRLRFEEPDTRRFFVRGRRRLHARQPDGQAGPLRGARRGQQTACALRHVGGPVGGSTGAAAPAPPI